MATQISTHLDAIKKEGRAKNPAKRTRWDATYAAKLSPWICANLYSYANDEHIDTALRSAMREIGVPDAAI